ncbi:hypothetical protein BDZ94DRAFT_1184148 [Collybia nuda]|uniref:Fe2OG dioxygenase domain-containing protein n=1 Tax=Collybia nuda TaxID=64659 RepID=A0A9P5YGG9_9AGAR|nr:hypothetical protein BDZ94DRAFT_1184148 [Collybia nuda]
MASENIIPVIDISPFASSPLSTSPSAEQIEVANKIYEAFHSSGFIQIIGHGISEDLQNKLLQSTEQFFARPEEEKMVLHVKNGGVAWRGYMPYGGEGTRGRVDQKEGIYFGPEHPDDHPQIGLPLHGKNQFPDATVPEMRPAVLQYIKEVSEMGKTISDALSLALGMDGHFIRDNYLQAEPLVFFRAWKYKRVEDDSEGGVWGIGEHSDFGYLTILKQCSPGLQILSPKGEWANVPVIENAFICNVGDMLDMMSGGRLRSTFHRVLPPAPGTHRISFPLFFDFSWTAKMAPLPLSHLPPLSPGEEAQAKERWEKTTFTGVNGEWWQYLAKKVKKVFPELVLPDFEANVKSSSRFAIVVPTPAPV